MTAGQPWTTRTLDWSPRLSVGVESIDEQHRELFRRANRFLGALSERRGRDEVEPLLEFLGEYIHAHFQEEMKMMRLSSYVGLGEHLAEHQRFARAFHELAVELHASGPTAGHARRIEALLVDWLEDHVARTDRELGDWLQRALAPRRGAPSA